MAKREEFPLLARFLDGATQGDFESIAAIEALLIDKTKFTPAEIMLFREAEEAMAKHHTWSREMALKEGDKHAEHYQYQIDEYQARHRGAEPEEPGFSLGIGRTLGHREDIARALLAFTQKVY